MRRSLLWIITLCLPLIFLGLLAYLLKDSVFSINWSELKASDLVNLGALAIGFFGAFIAIGSLSVAVSQLQQAINDGAEQKQSLDASRKQLEAVVESFKKQHELQTQSLETFKALLATQERVVETTKKQHEVQVQSLETSKALLLSQEEERKRMHELASKRPMLQLVIGDVAFDKDNIEIDLTVGQNNHAVLLTALKNIGSDTLRRPVQVATVSPKEISAWFDNTSVAPKPYRSQLSGMNVLDILPYSTSANIYTSYINLIVPSPIPDFDINYNVTGDNLIAPFNVIIHVHVKR